MAPWMVRKAKASWLLGFVIVLAGLLPELPRVPAVWVDGSLVRMPLNKVVQIPPRLYAGLAVAAFGLLTMVYGARIARRQIAVLEAAKHGKEDRLRRVSQHAGEERIEPYIGDTITIEPDSEPK